MYKQHRTKKLYFTISEAAERAGINASKIRFWDNAYMLCRRKAGEARRFNRCELARILLFKRHHKFLTIEGRKLYMDGKLKIEMT